MYRQKPFDIADADDLVAFIRAAGPAHLVTLGSHGLTSSIVPMLVDQAAAADASVSLIGHLARANPQWRDVEGGVDALAIFTGADAYISPSFYPTKAETGKVVPTWNYSVVHAHGRLVIHDDPAWTTDLVRRLTDRHEADRERPWSIDDAPPGYIETTVKGIVGVELVVSRIEGARKLSQNRNDADIAGVVEGLGQGTPAQRQVADEVSRFAERSEVS